jgi:hypothetical protein
MHIVEQIINLIPKWSRVFIQDCGTYNHQNAHFVSLHINLFSKNNIKHNDLSTLSIVICRLPVMRFTRSDIGDLSYNIVNILPL